MKEDRAPLLMTQGEQVSAWVTPGHVANSYVEGKSSWQECAAQWPWTALGNVPGQQRKLEVQLMLEVPASSHSPLSFVSFQLTRSALALLPWNEPSALTVSSLCSVSHQQLPCLLLSPSDIMPPSDSGILPSKGGASSQVMHCPLLSLSPPCSSNFPHGSYHNN